MRRRKAHKQADIASRKASSKRELSGAFLEGTETSVTEIEQTATTGFGEAWVEGAHDGRDNSFDRAIDGGHDDSRARNLDRSRVGTYIGALIVLVGVGAAAFFGTRAFTSESGLGARASVDPNRNVLASPLADRTYSEFVTPVVVDTFAPLDAVFVTNGDDGTVTLVGPDDDLDESFPTATAGSVFWAGRLHIAVLSAGDLLPDGACLITSLVTSELIAVDVASVGECADDFSATGDRVACQGPNVALLEVWPLNPDSLTEPLVTSAVRTRIEIPTDTTPDGDLISVRGSIDVSLASGVTPVVTSASTLAGAPGDRVTINVGDLSAVCSLIDRSDVDVRLLPG